MYSADVIIWDILDYKLVIYCKTHKNIHEYVTPEAWILKYLNALMETQYVHL